MMHENDHDLFGIVVIQLNEQHLKQNSITDNNKLLVTDQIGCPLIQTIDAFVWLCYTFHVAWLCFNFHAHVISSSW